MSITLQKMSQVDICIFLNNVKEAMLRAANLSQPQHGTLYWQYFRRHGRNHVLVMDPFEKSLRTLKQNYGHLSLQSVQLIGIQLTKRVEALHNRGYIHRNIKPENLGIGKVGEDRKCLYLIDYSLTKQFQDAGGVYNMFTMGDEWHGSKILGLRQTYRCDPESWISDLESVIYLIIYLLTRLPWDCVPELDSISTVLMKENVTDDDLCRGLPTGIRRYYRDVVSLSNFERSDYEKLRGYLEENFRRYMNTDEGLEWTRAR